MVKSLSAPQLMSNKASADYWYDSGHHGKARKLLCGLAHYCNQNGYSFDQVVQDAKAMFLADITPTKQKVEKTVDVWVNHYVTGPCVHYSEKEAEHGATGDCLFVAVPAKVVYTVEE